MKKTFFIGAITAVLFFCIEFIRAENAALPEKYSVLSGQQCAYMNAQIEAGHVSWGLSTNQMHIGLVLGEAAENNLSLSNVFIGVVVSNSTSGIFTFLKPPIPFQFNMVVFDEKGGLVERASAGANMGKEIPKKLDFNLQNSGDSAKWSSFLDTFRRQSLNPHEARLFSNVNVCDYFNIKKPGKYRVEYEQRLQFIDFDLHQIDGITWSKISIILEIH